MHTMAIVFVTLIKLGRADPWDKHEWAEFVLI